VTDFSRGRFVLRSYPWMARQRAAQRQKRPILCRYWPMAAISMEIRPRWTVSDRKPPMHKRVAPDGLPFAAFPGKSIGVGILC